MAALHGRDGEGKRPTSPRPDLATGSLLAGLGVEPAEEEIYRALLRGGPGTAAEVADRVDGTSADQVLGRVPRLQALGLVTVIGGRPGGLVPTRPDVAIDALAARRVQEISRSQLAVPALLEEASLDGERPPDDLLDVVRGREGVALRFVHLHDIAEGELRVLVRPPYAHGPVNPESHATAAIARGVRIRGIYSPEALQSPSVLAHVDRNRTFGEEARIGEVPLKLVIADRRYAMLPLTLGYTTTDNALVIHASALLDALVSLFDALWRGAVPFPSASPPEDAHAAVRENQVLALLTAGATDEAIGRQLGVSARTVQRHVRRILDDLGAQTRFQAGLKLERYARQGDAPEPPSTR